MQANTYFDVLPMKNISILWAVHQDFRAVSFLGSSTIPPVGLFLAHAGPFAACVPHSASNKPFQRSHRVGGQLAGLKMICNTKQNEWIIWISMVCSPN